MQFVKFIVTYREGNCKNIVNKPGNFDYNDCIMRVREGCPLSISSETVQRLAVLSRLELTRTEQEQLSAELETVVNYMDMLAQLPAEAAAQDAPDALHNVLRDDRAICSADRSVLLSNAPCTDGATLSVPKTVD